jgi:hypothetical protein
MGILDISDLRNYYWVFYMITKFLLTKNQISEPEQSWAFVRGFQPDFWHWISHRLKIKLHNHDPDEFYALSEINEAAKYVLYSISQNCILQPSVTLTAPPTQQASPYIKAEDLLMLFKQMAQSFPKVLAPQKSMLPDPAPMPKWLYCWIHNLSYAFCG